MRFPDISKSPADAFFHRSQGIFEQKGGGIWRRCGELSMIYSENLLNGTNILLKINTKMEFNGL